MNEKELAEIEARAEAATPGPWDIGHEAPPLYAGNSCITVKLGERMAIIFEANHNFELDNSANFIARARQDVPTLVAEVRRLSGENERLLATIQDTCTWSEDDDTDDVIWDTECGETVVFEDGTPKENGYRHCHYCGKNIIFSLKGGAQ